MKSAPLSDTIRHSRIFSSSVSRQVSMITFSTSPPQAAFTALISESRSSQRPSLAQPMLITMSISFAPLATASLASNTLTAVVE